MVPILILYLFIYISSLDVIFWFCVPITLIATHYLKFFEKKFEKPTRTLGEPLPLHHLGMLSCTYGKA